MKYCQLLLVISSILFVACKSREQRLLDTIADLTEQYIEDVNNADSYEEFKELYNTYDEHIKFEINKFSQEELDAIEKNTSWEENQYFKNLSEREREATKNARNRLRHN